MIERRERNKKKKEREQGKDRSAKCGSSPAQSAKESSLTVIQGSGLSLMPTLHNEPDTDNGVATHRQTGLPKTGYKCLVVGLGGKKIVFSQKGVAAVLWANAGLIAQTAKALQTSYANLKKFIDDNPKVQKEIELIRDARLDIAEEKLWKKIEHDESERSIHFYLRTQGKSRGYIEDDATDVAALAKPINFYYNIVQGNQQNITDKAKQSAIDIASSASHAVKAIEAGTGKEKPFVPKQKKKAEGAEDVTKA